MKKAVSSKKFGFRGKNHVWDLKKVKNWQIVVQNARFPGGDGGADISVAEGYTPEPMLLRETI